MVIGFKRGLRCIMGLLIGVDKGTRVRIGMWIWTETKTNRESS